jgi:hypothetical protein
MKNRRKIGVSIVVVLVIAFLGYFIYTNFIHYKLYYSGYSPNKDYSIENDYFVAEFKPDIDSIEVNGTYTVFKNLILEKAWESIGDPNIKENEKRLTGSYQLIVPLELGVVDLNFISPGKMVNSKKSLGHPFPMLVFHAQRNLEEASFEIEIRDGATWKETIVIDTITYRRINQ